jgi:hypothetical protein
MISKMAAITSIGDYSELGAAIAGSAGVASAKDRKRLQSATVQISEMTEVIRLREEQIERTRGENAKLRSELTARRHGFKQGRGIGLLLGASGMLMTWGIVDAILFGIRVDNMVADVGSAVRLVLICSAVAALLAMYAMWDYYRACQPNAQDNKKEPADVSASSKPRRKKAITLSQMHCRLSSNTNR